MMKNLLKLEELAQFGLCLGWLILFEASWWWYPLLLLGPDIAMLGYVVNSSVGAFCYNLFHHKAMALIVLCAGALWQPDIFEVPYAMLPGIVMYGHASMDRIFGYGLKFGDNFHHTHLGWIGKVKDRPPLV